MRKAYPSDLTDEQWASIGPLVPVNRVGRPRRVDMRGVLGAIFYQDRSGCRWGMLPHDLSPESTAHDHLAQWRDDGTRRATLDALRRRVRTAGGRDPDPSVAGIGSRTVKATEVADGRGHDGGKKVSGRKRHIIVDKPGLLPVAVVSVASADDGTIAPGILGRLTAGHRAESKGIWADGKYRGHHLDDRLERTGAGYAIEVVGRPSGSVGSVERPRRHVVERTSSWLGRYRRQSRDYERSTESSAAMVRIGAIHRMPRLSGRDQSMGSVPFKYREPRGEIAG